MTQGLPSSGKLSIGDISVELLRSRISYNSLGDGEVRQLLGREGLDPIFTNVPVFTGWGWSFQIIGYKPRRISISNGYGKRWITPNPNGITFSTSTVWTVPRYQTITFRLFAGGGGGAGGYANDGFDHGYNGGNGGNGQNTTAYTLTAHGGQGAYYVGGNRSGDPRNGAPGDSGGGVPGGTGGGGVRGPAGGTGGTGGYITRTWNYQESGHPPWGSQVSITIGGGGAGGGGGGDAFDTRAGAGNPGTAGFVNISWT